MRRILTTSAVLLFSILAVLEVWRVNAQEKRSPSEMRQAAADAQQKGNFKEALTLYRALCLNPKNDPQAVGEDLRHALQNLRQLGVEQGVDELLEAAIKTHSKNWRLLEVAAESYRNANHYGFIVSGKFERGWRREQSGRPVNAAQRDRRRSLQLLESARELALQALRDAPDESAAVANVLWNYADSLRFGTHGPDAWRFQTLTDLTELPDYEDGHHWEQHQTRGAPVDEVGQPIYHAVPDSWAAAKSDGERWRWLLTEVARIAPQRKAEMEFHFAVFCQEQFGPETLATLGYWPAASDEKRDPNASGTFALHTLSDDETIARLAIGVRRFKLPDEHNYLKLFCQLAAAGRSNWSQHAQDLVANAYLNRRQFDRAAVAWREAIEKYGAGVNDNRRLSLEQIVKNWGRFESATTQPAGKGATVGFRYRNASSVSFDAAPIDVAQFLGDIKAYLKKQPGQLDWNIIQLQQLGHRLVTENQRKYVGASVAKWDVALKPREGHVDDLITVTTPLQQPGAYLVKATVEGGNVSHIILWVADTVVTQKPLHHQQLFFVADAVTGQPVARSNVEFIGWKQVHVPKTNRFNLEFANFAEFTNADGQVVLDQKRADQQMQWLVIARGENKSEKGRLAFLGFTHIWFPDHHDVAYEARKVIAITDRPVYRPEQKVQFKLWLRDAKYDQPDTSSFAGQGVKVVIQNSQGEKVREVEGKLDQFGGISGEYALPKNAGLGVYQLHLEGYGGGSFRVEEYKKPEFEVTVDAPSDPVALGEKITATIKARYYFGAPVQHAKVRYTVKRSRHDAQWYPRGDWDWFYGRGYWWFGQDYRWYPRWSHWGCMRPMAWWWPRAHLPPEVVLDRETEIGPDGTVSVEIDTQLAKELHGDQDHSYSITAEVVDESRRTIVGNGQVLVARRPFKVFVWVDRGHFVEGDTIHASVQAQTLDQKPILGQGQLKLIRIDYLNGEPQESVVEQWELATDQQGSARHSIKAAKAGQYRLAYTLSDGKGHTEEGGFVFVIRGPGFDGQRFQFNDLELITDKREYRPGEKVRLLINTNREDASVLLFLRPANGVYLTPKLVRLKGKSTVEEIDVGQRDMPNFFIEALTVSQAKVHSEVREVVVPPERRVINVAVTPSKERFKPGEEAEIEVRLTDSQGQPIQGATVLSVYDKSLEYISGGSNVPEIREHFWKWRRHHQPSHTQSSLQWCENLLRQNDVGMGDLGLFGGSALEEMAASRRDTRTRGFAMRSGGLGGGFGGGRMEMLAKSQSAMPGAAPAALAADKADAAFAALGDANAPAGPNADEAGGVQPTLRSQFADTAFWAASIDTDAEGRGRVKFRMPENLTGWKVRAWSLSHGTKVGQGDAAVVTAKNVLVRLQAPRFFVERDEVVLTANVHNYLDRDKEVRVKLDLEGGTLAPMQGELTQTVSIKAGGERRVDWRVKVTAEGLATVRMSAITDEESDAMQQQFPCLVHGILKTESFSGVIRPQQESGEVVINVPDLRRVEQTRLELRYSPTLAGAMVDALPYLVDYPYGCTEQTLNRFLPTVITQRVLQRMKLDLAAIRDKRTNLNAQEIGDDQQRATRWKKLDRQPVFDPDEVTAMAKDGVQVLTSMQLADGGWGWFSGFGEHSWPHTTAVVVHGLHIATQNDIALVPNTLERGTQWLIQYQASEVQKLKNAPSQTRPWKDRADDIDALVYYVLSERQQQHAEMREFLYRDRIQLSLYAKSLVALAYHHQKHVQYRDMLLQNLDQFVVEDDENQTAYLKLPQNSSWWFWYGHEIETQAWYLKLLTAVEPQGQRASRLVKYILNNRGHGGHWKSTRDTAYVIEALADYCRASGEIEPNLELEIAVDGKLQKRVAIKAENLFSFDNKLVLEGAALTSGRHVVSIKKSGTGPVYFNAYLTNFTQEEQITRAGLEIKVDRKFYRLIPQAKETLVAGSRGNAVRQRTQTYERVAIDDLTQIKSGELIEVELGIDSKNDYEYVLFEDMKPAGGETVDVRSGYTGNELGAYVEYRDNRVALFVRSLPRGHHSVSYRMRAEIPGRFTALPTMASAMYSPELRANSDEGRIQIVDPE